MASGFTASASNGLSASRKRNRILLPASQRVSALQSGGFVWAAFALMVVFNVMFPKGGIRIYGFPITWGYLAIAAITVFSMIGILRRKDLSIAPIVQATCLFLPIAIIVYFKAQHFSLPSNEWLQYAVVFGFFPIAILVAMAPYLEQLETRHIAGILRISIRVAVAWGLLNFLLYLVAKQIVEVPYLTVNGQEEIQIVKKNNMRGTWLKLASTYNNGNIFGVCMIMLMPLYFHFERRKYWLAAFVLAVLCTLSRTAWFGLTGAFILMVISGQIKINRASVWLSAAGAFAVFLAILPMLGWTSANLIDDRLGGRLKYLRKLEITFFGQDFINIPEVVYYGLLQCFGLVGFVIAVAALAFGAVYGLMNWSILSPMRRAAVLGTLAYLFVCTMDGAFIFPPVVPIFLLINALIYRRGYRRKEDLRAQAAIRHRRGLAPGPRPLHAGALP